MPVCCENGIFPGESLNKKGFYYYHHFVVTVVVIQYMQCVWKTALYARKWKNKNRKLWQQRYFFPAVVTDKYAATFMASYVANQGRILLPWSKCSIDTGCKTKFCRFLWRVLLSAFPSPETSADFKKKTCFLIVVYMEVCSTHYTYKVSKKCRGYFSSVQIFKM